MKLKYAFMIYFLYIVSASFVSAEYYQYVDKNGIKHFTDDISEVPKDQRPNLNIYQSIQTPEKKELPVTEKKTNTISYESLVIQKSELDIEYQTLVKKQEAMPEQKKSLSVKKYNELVTLLNIEINQYQEKRSAYETLVKQYNDQVRPPKKN